MDKKKTVRLADVSELEADLKKTSQKRRPKARLPTSCSARASKMSCPTSKKLPTIDPKTLRPVAHWEEIPGSYKDHIGKDGSWFVPATRCTNPECREINPCSLKTPFCLMCGARMEDVPYDDD